MRRPLAAALPLLVALLASRAVADDAVTSASAAATTPASEATPAPTTPTLAPTATTTPAPARVPPQPHDGVMWRFSLGGAYVHGWSESNAMSRTVSAFPSLALSASLGHAVADNLVLHMDLAWNRSGAASYSSEGETIVDDVSITAVLLGVGMTYWIAPHDVFITGGLGLGQISTVSGAYRLVIEIPDIESTDVGVGGHVAIGKQWRVGRKWGIGPELRLGLMGAPQNFADASALKLLSVTLSASVTYD